MDGYLGEIRMFAGDFVPRNWALCNGTLMSIAQNAALFSIIGTIYDGDGRTFFALPDLRGRTPINPGQGLELNNYDLGFSGGSELVSIGINNIPRHTHNLSSNAVVSTTSGNLKVTQGVDNSTDDPALAKSIASQIKVGSKTINLLSIDNPTTTIENVVVNIESKITGETDEVGSGHKDTKGILKGEPFNITQPYLGINYIICIDGQYPSRS